MKSLILAPRGSPLFPPHPGCADFSSSPGGLKRSLARIGVNIEFHIFQGNNTHPSPLAIISERDQTHELMERTGALPPGYAKQQGLINWPAFNIPDVPGATILADGLVIKSNEVGSYGKIRLCLMLPFPGQLALITMSPSWIAAAVGGVWEFSLLFSTRPVAYFRYSKNSRDFSQLL